MRVAEFEVPGANPESSATMAVFSGHMGTVEDNVRRWFGQFTQSNGRSHEEVGRRWQVQSEAGLSATLVDVSGTYLAGMGSTESLEGYRMLGAIVDIGSGRFQYLKLTGPADTVARWAEHFEGAIASSRPG
ncbi:MAG: hypothetical protein VX733_11285 [Candidatus Latescibacterota bacterium]|nr:hypothetical protein [Candidatus Latescibacterota bacterium]